METIANIEATSHNDRRNRITLLNDHLRVNGIGGKIMMTRGVASLGGEMISNIINAMRQYSAWSPDNDPYGEHDFGIITLAQSQKVYFKIDYYDELMEYGSQDPADPQKTTRVLTLMLAEEY